MYADINERVDHLKAKIETVSNQMDKATGAKYEKLQYKLEKLEEKLEILTIWQNDMEFNFRSYRD